ncbi:hypothetical protein D0T50_10950 [Bacteroides sp. 214]|uniref:hypothetical protein n=1 Tax=Bacteroides sp. 214 TaxID=2302935 RepID=UPI0013D0228A|nr:hypothetical protein [Bacteroides sp. 214]NDW13406.1 hypothetical protein [Bacteroides sp. 214]
MPYRRLPNTDQARLRALQTAVDRASASDMYTMVISLKTLTEARNFLKRFEGAQTYYKECYDNQAKASHRHQSSVRMARLYLSHFIQVLNMSVVRSEIKKKTKELYGLPEDNNNVPDLTSEAAIAEWGKKVIAGEQQRISAGGIPIYNPTIAKVRVHYDIFMDGYNKQKNLQAITNRSLSELASMRDDADRIILDIWNQVEKNFEEVTPNEKRLDLCREYGVIYYYRSNEKPVV